MLINHSTTSQVKTKTTFPAKMWKRMQIARSREPHIGNPTLIETTVDEKTLQTMKRVPGKRDDIAGASKDSKNLPAPPQ